MYVYLQYIHVATDVLIRLDYEIPDEMSRNDWAISVSNRDGESTTGRCSISQRSEIETGGVGRTIE